MGLTESAVKEGASLVRDFLRWFSWDRLRQRGRSWLVREWVPPPLALVRFGDQNLAVKLEQAEAELSSLYVSIGSEVEAKRQDVQITRDALVHLLTDEIALKLLNGELLAKGFHDPLIHGAAYIPIQCAEWHVLRLDSNLSAAEGGGIKYIGLTVGRPVKLFGWSRPQSS